ncbi:MAG: hypothetical protein PVJ66_02855 [Gammaproteobacteria bacterium]
MDTLTRYSQQFVTRFARQFNRGSALGFILTIVLVALAVNLLFDFEPEVRESTAPQTFRGFRSFELTEDLSLPEAALNLKYYLTMSSACHESGANAAQAAYSYLYNATNRYMQNGKWSFKQVRDAIQASRKTYQEIYTALECRADSDNYHGLDLDSDLRLKTLALNLQFYQEKVPVCKKAGNKVDMRAYGHLANMEHRMLYSGRYTVEQIQKAISEAKTSPDRQKIHGC